MFTRNVSTRVFAWALALCFFAITAPLMALPMGSAFTYQGQLNQGTSVANGSYDFWFRLYDAPAAGTQIGNATTTTVQVANGIFTVSLDFGDTAFAGSARFLQIDVKSAGGPTYTALSPRQELKPAPNAVYAASAAKSGSTPWAGLTGGDANMVTSSTTYGIRVQNTSTGDGVRSYTNATSPNYAALFGGNNGAGTGVYGHSSNGLGVLGISDGGGDGVEGQAASADKSGVFGHSGDGVGVFGRSDANDGVVGVSHGTGVSGVYGNNDGASPGYGITGRSANGFGIQAIGSEEFLIDDVGDILLGGDLGEIFSFGYMMSLYSNGSVRVDLDNDNNDIDTPSFSIRNGTDNNVFSVSESGWAAVATDLWIGRDTTILGNLTVSGSKTGYVVDIAQNDDTVALEAGDVVAISGAGEPVLGQIPVIKVRRATEREAGAVAGVVDRAYQPEPKSEEPVAGAAAPKDRKHIKEEAPKAMAVYSNGPVPPGGYCTMVTLGSFKAIKVDASAGAIHPGDRLTASPRAGFAMRASTLVPGTIVGKALGSLETGVGVIPVLVTLQ